MLIQEHLATCLAEGSNASQAYQRTLHDMMKQHPPKKKVYQLGLALKTKILNQENQMKTERRQKKNQTLCSILTSQSPIVPQILCFLFHTKSQLIAFPSQ